MNKNNTTYNWFVVPSKLLWSLFFLTIFFLVWMSVEKRKGQNISGTSIHIRNLSDKKNLVSKKEIIKSIEQILQKPINEITIEQLYPQNLETHLLQDKRIKNLEVYIDNTHKIHIYIEQRQPIVRVQTDHTTYYLDNESHYIPVVQDLSIRVPIATGNIGNYHQSKFGSKSNNNLKDIFVIANHIQKDIFLKALIEQINIDENGEILLVPKIGGQELAFGKVADLDEKFGNLKKFYNRGITKIGWQKYKRLVLNWEGQIVGQKEQTK